MIAYGGRVGKVDLVDMVDAVDRRRAGREKVHLTQHGGHQC
jgi:hypothetical protein